jgi:hypothetical protein
MKFILVMSVCSFITGECLPPIQSLENFDDWKPCAIKGLQVGAEVLEAMDINTVNEYKLSIQYSCKPIVES